MNVEGRYRPTELRNDLVKAAEHFKSTQRQYFGIVVGFILLTVAVMAWAAWSFDDPGASIVCGMLSFFVVIFVVLGFFSGVRRSIDKVGFAQGLLDQLFDDLHPAKKLRFHLDTSSYDLAGKQYWSGRSQHGNSKYRYNDSWLKMKFSLIDGTIVTIERRADVKTRKGSIQKEKRRLYIKVKPNPASFGELRDAEGLEDLVKQRVKEGFHDPPEQIKVDAQPGEDGLRIRISQWDAPIRESEAFLMVETVLLFLHMRR